MLPGPRRACTRSAPARHAVPACAAARRRPPRRRGRCGRRAGACRRTRGAPSVAPSSDGRVEHAREEVGARRAPASSRATASSGSSAPSAASSGIQVLPSWTTSGSASPTNAVRSFSCAALHGICCTRTRTPGWRASKAGHQRAHALALAPERPELDRAGVLRPARAEDEEEGCEPAASHPRWLQGPSAASRARIGAPSTGAPGAMPSSAAAVGCTSTARACGSSAPFAIPSPHAYRIPDMPGVAGG